jgi:hypothetical protein
VVTRNTDERSRVRRWLPAFVVTTVIGGAVGVALAANQSFSDVPPSHPFFKEIEAIKGAGITTGSTECSPAMTPAYCPDSLVRRDAMAAFMHRGFSRVASNGPIEVGASGGVGTFQQILVTGEIEVDTSLGDSTGTDGCPCVIGWDLEIIGRGGVEPFAVQSGREVVGPAVGGVVRDTVDLFGVFTVPDWDGEFEISTWFYVLDSEGAVPPGEGVSVARSHLTAVVVPFGWDGGIVLDPELGLWKFNAEATCDGALVTGRTASGLLGYFFRWASTDDPALGDTLSMYDYSFAGGTFVRTLGFGGWDFDVILGDGTVVDELPGLDGTYSKPGGCP